MRKQAQPTPVAVLFSGGADSTAVAVQLLREGREVRLLTFDNGAEQGLERAGEQAARIRRRFGGRSTWELLDSSALFRNLAIAPLAEDVRRHGRGGNLVCCGCKLAMLAQAIVYCRRNGIGELADGFRRGQSFYPEQTEEYIAPTDRFALSYRVRCLHPLWDRPRPQPEKAGPSPRQPRCLFGENPIRDRSGIRPYVESKLSALKAYVDGALRSAGRRRRRPNKPARFSSK